MASRAYFLNIGTAPLWVPVRKGSGLNHFGKGGFGCAAGGTPTAAAAGAEQELTALGFSASEVDTNYDIQQAVSGGYGVVYTQEDPTLPPDDGNISGSSLDITDPTTETATTYPVGMNQGKVTLGGVRFESAGIASSDLLTSTHGSTLTGATGAVTPVVQNKYRQIVVVLADISGTPTVIGVHGADATTALLALVPTRAQVNFAMATKFGINPTKFVMLGVVQIAAAVTTAIPTYTITNLLH